MVPEHWGLLLQASLSASQQELEARHAAAAGLEQTCAAAEAQAQAAQAQVGPMQLMQGLSARTSARVTFFVVLCWRDTCHGVKPLPPAAAVLGFCDQLPPGAVNGPVACLADQMHDTLLVHCMWQLSSQCSRLQP